MTITEVKQSLGSWGIKLREDTPRAILDALTYFGHVAIMPGKVDPAQYGDNLLTTARYVGVFQHRDAQDELTLSGSGMAFWLGDGDEKGDVFETPVVLNAQTFATSVPALLPPGGSVVPGTIHSVPGTYTGKHQWETPRKALTYVTDTFGAEWRINGDATLDAGTVAQLYVTTPQALLLRNEEGRELSVVAFPGKMRMATDVQDYTTRVVLLAEGEGSNIATGSADVPVTPYKDLRGNPIRSTRLVSESDTAAENAEARAQLQLNRFVNARQSVSLSTSAFDVKGSFVVGDYLNVYDPANGYVDLDRQVWWKGQPINPVALRCVEMSWPVEAGFTVAFRDINGVWFDLSPYYVPESGDTTIVVGDFNRSIGGMGGESVGIRPNLPDAPEGSPDTTVPAAPAFTGFSTGAYQSGTTSTTKAAIRAQWNQPLNGDGSTIQDGDHYEIRYRVNAVIGYHVSWDQLASYSWDDLGTWDAMISSPVSADPQWMTAYVGWDTLAYTITELTPGVQYEFQIRAVDTASPPNNGPWSASSFVVTTGDIIAPSTPETPVVAGSMTAIQVVHSLGKASGGTFNLEQDLDHLDVHVGGVATFTPDDSTKIGELIANAGMILGEIPAVGTFQVEQIGPVWVRVVAVDRAGNRSGASEGVTATAELIDNAHISDLSVSKLTAGTITASIVNAGEIMTSTTGSRMILNGSGLETRDENNYFTSRLLADQSRMEFSNPGFLYPPVEIGNTTDDTWGVKVQNLFGETMVRMGELVPNGDGHSDYGLAAVDPDTGLMVSLSTLAFGMEASDVSSAIFINNTSYAPHAAGPTLFNVRVGPTRRCLILISGAINYDYDVPTGTRTGYMSVRVWESGPTGALIYPGGDNFALYWAGDGASFLGMNASRMVFLGPSYLPHEGEYDIEIVYRSSGPMSFANRQLVVMPF